MNEFFLNFHFLRPAFLLALIPAILVFFYLLRSSQRATEWRSLVAEHLLPYLLDGEQSKSSKAPYYLLLFVWAISAIALAGPTWEKLPQPLKKDASALVVLYDLSPSMNTEDFKPSRYMRARLKLVDLLDARTEGLSALIVYSGQAHVVTPLTDDVETIKNLLPSLSPTILPERGSNAEMALREANKLLKDAGIARGNILFMTDGISRSAFGELKSLYEAGGHRISVWGFGSEEGAPIPLAEGGFARRNNGEIVVAGLDHSELSEAATRMNGVYIPYTESTEDIQNILNYGMNEYNEQQREVDREFDQWLEFGPWLVLLCLPFAALAFRRGLILPLLLFAVALPPGKSYANSDTDVLQQVSDAQATPQTAEVPSVEPSMWDTLWQTQDQIAQKKMHAGENKQAAELFESESHKAAAHFRAQEFDKSANLWDKENATASDFYNRGTALTHAGQYEDALKAFDQALALQPDLAKAKNNKQIAQQLKDLQEQQQSDQNQQQDQKQQQDQNQPQDQQQDQNQQNTQQNQQQGSNQEQQDQQSQQQAQNSESSDSDSREQSGQPSEEDKNKDQQARENFSQQMAEAEEKAQQQKQQEQAAQESEQQAENKEQAKQQLVATEESGQSEEEQSLEQWLRKVPDDPGRILRNKFKHEYRQRAMELDSRSWNTPENNEEERW